MERKRVFIQTFSLFQPFKFRETDLTDKSTSLSMKLQVLPGGVTVAHVVLVLSVEVRILAGQPVKGIADGEKCGAFETGIGCFRHS